MQIFLGQIGAKSFGRCDGQLAHLVVAQISGGLVLYHFEGSRRFACQRIIALIDVVVDEQQAGDVKLTGDIDELACIVVVGTCKMTVGMIEMDISRATETQSTHQPRRALSNRCHTVAVRRTFPAIQTKTDSTRH